MKLLYLPVDFECGESDLFNFDGRCINTGGFSPPSLAYKIDDSSFATFTDAPLCGPDGDDTVCGCDPDGCSNSDSLQSEPPYG